ncbi:hypothetical protein ATZ36_01440 [Candidatus Endomicrobiellum trichonymphae]|uniref:Uncharacterized protein n=1 Tax=Endomicrobium trichonymphae TaxID=1408204 RepID=A0A1E5IIB8_ENDTX|nr:hypothetical protein ATZ36_01440 [Candidatus Endomicrobium trichonymphae]
MHSILSFLFLLPLKTERYSSLDGKDLKWRRRKLTVKYILELLTVERRNIKERNEFFDGKLRKPS